LTVNFFVPIWWDHFCPGSSSKFFFRPSRQLAKLLFLFPSFSRSFCFSCDRAEDPLLRSVFMLSFSLSCTTMRADRSFSPFPVPTCVTITLAQLNPLASHPTYAHSPFLFCSQFTVFYAFCPQHPEGSPPPSFSIPASADAPHK